MSTTPPSSTPDDDTSIRRGALSGVLAAAVGLGLGELVASAVADWSSPVLAIGDQIVDLVPRPVKDLAIALFDTGDKAALLIGIVVLLALAAAGIGVLARTRRTPALGLTALFGVVGVVATLAGGATVAAALPSLAAGVGAVAALALLVPSGDAPGATTAPDRRSFVRTAGLVGLAAAATGGTGRLVSVRRSAAAADARAAVGLPTPTTPVELDLASLGVDAEGVSPWVTPNADFYRIDTQLQVPRLDRTGWTLDIAGMVDTPFSLTLDELEDRYEVIERAITLTCVSNEVGGQLVGNATWLGVRLADVLEDAGVQPGSDQLVSRSFDGWTAGFPVDAAFDRDALLAVGMNGEPLPAEHGFPLRLVVPGLYGYVSATKWLTQLELTTFDAFDQYWVERGWDARGPIKTQCRIDTPAGLSRLGRGQVAVAGVAWAQTRGITGVEVSVDDGPFQPATLADAYDDVTWRQWVYSWDTSDLAPGRHDIVARATDGTGETQAEERQPPFPNGAEGWQRLVVTLDA